MRGFTDTEKIFIKEIVAYKQNNDIMELLLSKLIKNKIGLVAIGWDIGDYNVTFYSENNNAEEGNAYYFQFSDFLYFIEELESMKFIKLDKHSTPNDIKDIKLIYDHELYTTELPENIQKYIKGSLKGTDFYRLKKDNDGNNEEFIWLPTSESKYNVHLAEMIDKYASCIIYPLPLLEDLCKHKFKSIEQRHFNTQLWINVISIFIATLAVIVAALGPYYAPDSKIDIDQLNNIDSLIRSVKTEYPTKIEVALPDTLTIKDIETNKTINNIHIHNGKYENGVNGYDSIQHR